MSGVHRAFRQAGLKAAYTDSVLQPAAANAWLKNVVDGETFHARRNELAITNPSATCKTRSGFIESWGCWLWKRGDKWKRLPFAC